MYFRGGFLNRTALKMDLQRRYGATVLTGVVRGGVLVEPPLIEKGGVAKNDLCTSL